MLQLVNLWAWVAVALTAALGLYLWRRRAEGTRGRRRPGRGGAASVTRRRRAAGPRLERQADEGPAFLRDLKRREEALEGLVDVGPGARRDSTEQP